MSRTYKDRISNRNEDRNHDPYRRERLIQDYRQLELPLFDD